MSRGGFTLIELMVVLVLLGALLGLSAPAFRRSYRRMACDAAADRLEASILLARERAVMEGRAVRLSFDPSGEGFRLRRSGTVPGSAPETWERGERLPADVRLPADLPPVDFHPDGGASAAAAWELANAQDDRWCLTLDPLLGRVMRKESPCR